MAKWLTPAAVVVALIKPQFEAGRNQVGKGGVVRDLKVHRQVLQQVISYAETVGLQPLGLIPSPIIGPAGNHEFLIHLGWQTQLPLPEIELLVETSIVTLKT